MFDSNSRYFNLPTKLLTTPAGDAIAYKGRRLLPPLKSKKSLGETRIIEGDRLDLIAYRLLGDPLNYWQIADVNTAMHPQQLTEEVGSFIKIPLASVQGG